jgi:hypothetical protein
MQTLITTGIIAAIIFGLAVIGLSIGLIITGRSKIRRGMCARPHETEAKKDPSCPLCGAKDQEPCQKEEKPKEEQKR